MSRDWTPKERYLVEQHDLKTNTGIGSIWNFMENAVWVVNGETIPLHSVEEIALRKQYPVIGKFLEVFEDLYDKLSQFDGGVEFLHQKDAELATYIETGKGDSASYLVKWFEGELDEGFYYGERNDQLLIEAICQEAMEKGLNNWTLTDPDCCQVRRQIGFEEQGVFQLMQIDMIKIEDCPAAYNLAWAEIDLSDYSKAERISALNGYCYENMKELVEAAGSQNEAYGQLAEMFFELHANEFYVMEFNEWNDAVAEVEHRTGLDLHSVREADAASLEALIRNAATEKSVEWMIDKSQAIAEVGSDDCRKAELDR